MAGLFRAAVLAFLCLVLMAASTTLTLILVAELLSIVLGPAGLSVVTAVFDLLDVTCLLYALAFLTSKNTGIASRLPRMTRVLHPTIVTAFMAHVLTLSLLSWLQSITYEVNGGFLAGDISTVLAASWAVFAASCLVHALFLFQAWPKRSVKQSASDTTASISPPSSPDAHDESMVALPSRSPACEAALGLETRDEKVHHHALAPRSKQHVLQSISSRTRLIPNGANAPIEQVDQSSEVHPSPLMVFSPQLNSAPSSARTSSEYNGSLLLQETSQSHAMTTPIIARPVTPVGRALTPIPGSNPNSPGKPLDFAAREPERGRQNARKSYELDTAVQQECDESRVPPRFRKNSLVSRPLSPAVDESLIHPLFRSDSPLPPPTPMLATTVTASAFGGREMSREDFRTRSRPASPSQLRNRSATVSEQRGAASPTIARSRSAVTSRRESMAPSLPDGAGLGITSSVGQG